MFGKRRSEHSVRLRGLNSNISDDDFNECIRTLSGEERAFRTHSSLATQGAFKCATVTCPSSSHKDSFRRRLRRSGLPLNMHPDGSPPHDDKFEGVTMLHTPDDAEVDICLVHSVTGNSMDTFSCSDRDWPDRPFVHWARDFLPQTLPRARIMIYDYNSQLFSSADSESYDNLAMTMLNQIDQYRTVDMQRPIIFVGYAYGGILIREAGMELYWDRNLTRRNYNTFDLTKSGFVFIATPQMGGSIRDMYSTASLYFPRKFGVRDQMYYKLQTFSADLVRSRQAWDNMRFDGIQPLIASFAEQRATPTFPFRTEKFIVKWPQTHFMGVDSVPIPNKDHRSISTYTTPADEGFTMITAAIERMSQRFSQASHPGPPSIDDFRQSIYSATPVSQRSTFFLTVQLDYDNLNTLFTSLGLAKPDATNIFDKSVKLASKRLKTASVRDLAATDTVLTGSTIADSELSRRPSKVQWQQGNPDRNMPSLLTPYNAANGNGGKTTPSETPKNQLCWDKTSILTLDGGGLRGYAALLMLKALMEKVESVEKEAALRDAQTSDQDPPWLRRPESPFCASNPPSQRPSRRFSNMSTASSLGGIKRRESPQPKPISKMTYLPCHYFDFIAGTGTGGILAIMLGRLRMSVSECLSDFSGLLMEAFGRPETSLRLSLGNYKGSVKRFEDGLVNLIAFRSGHKTGLGSEVLLRSDEDLCKTIVVAARHSKTTEVGVRLLRSYATERQSKNDRDAEKLRLRQPFTDTKPRNAGPADKVPIWMCARATTSAPTYFKPLMIGDEKFKDGSLGYNNPSREVLREVMIKNNNDQNSIHCLVSIGCGIPSESKDEFFKPHKAVRSRVLDPGKLAAFEGDDIHMETRSMMAGPGRRNDYFRFNATASAKAWGLPTKALIADMDNPGYHAKSKLDEEVDRELAKTETQSRVETCAKILVRQRRERAKDKHRWQRFSTAIQYRCVHDSLAFNGKESLVQHFKEEHLLWWEKELTVGLRKKVLDDAATPPQMLGGP